MGMVDRYKKSGGFVQLIQIIETCNIKKREQFMNIITEESPQWAEAINQKCITFDKIITWKTEIILDIMASVNLLSFSTALKALTPEKLETFFQKISHQDRKKIEMSMQESTPSPNEISASVVKVITETRALFIQGTLKADRVDPQLAIPDGFEAMLDRNEYNKIPDGNTLSFDGPGQSLNFNINNSSVSTSNNGSAAANADVEKLQKKLTLLSKEVQTLRSENQVMREKLDRIKRIA